MKERRQPDGIVVLEELDEDELPEPSERLRRLVEHFAGVAPTVEEVRRRQVHHFAVKPAVKTLRRSRRRSA
jgi:hypothetical protein